MFSRDPIALLPVDIQHISSGKLLLKRSYPCQVRDKKERKKRKAVDLFQKHTLMRSRYGAFIYLSTQYNKFVRKCV